MAKKENEANKIKGGGRVGHVVVVLVVLVNVQVEGGDVVERWEGGIGDNDDYDIDNWTDGREGEC